MELNVLQQAEAFARTAHQSINQKRKYSGEPYIVHPAAVAKIVASVTDDPATLAAAWLHDVVEDTPITLKEIRDEFGNEIAELVDGLTNTANPEDGNRAERNRINVAHSAGAAPKAQTVKLADIIHNLSDLAQQDPGFARVYAAEKQLQVDVLTEGDSSLRQQAQAIITELTREGGDND